MHFLGRIFDDALPRNIRIELAFLHSCSFLCQKVLPVWNLLMCMFLRTSIVLCVQNTNFRLQVKYGKLNSIGKRAIRNCPVLIFGLPPREAGYSNVLGHHLLLWENNWQNSHQIAYNYNTMDQRGTSCWNFYSRNFNIQTSQVISINGELEKVVYMWRRRIS